MSYTLVVHTLTNRGCWLFLNFYLFYIWLFPLQFLFLPSMWLTNTTVKCLFFAFSHVTVFYIWGTHCLFLTCDLWWLVGLSVVTYSWFQTFAMLWKLYSFCWVITWQRVLQCQHIKLRCTETTKRKNTIVTYCLDLQFHLKMTADCFYNILSIVCVQWKWKESLVHIADVPYVIYIFNALRTANIIYTECLKINKTHFNREYLQTFSLWNQKAHTLYSVTSLKR